MVETCPTNCPDVDTWYRACEHASFYSSTVSLLPTHQPSTNAVVTRNRRIGVGIIDYTGWVAAAGQHNIIRALRKGYDIVSTTNRLLNAEAGVPRAIKCTTIKPGGTVPKLVGKTPGAGFATFNETLRRTRIANNSPLIDLLRESGIPIEPLVTDPLNSSVFEYPIMQTGRTASQVSIWEQALNIATIQREWADNAVSNTIYFKPKWEKIVDTWDVDEIQEKLEDFYISFNGEGVACPSGMGIKADCKVENGKILNLRIFKFNPDHEEDMIESVLSQIVPVIKMVSFLPHTANGVYKQMPESGISSAEYVRRKEEIDRIDWSKFSGSDGEDEKYCQGNQCELPVKG